MVNHRNMNLPSSHQAIGPWLKHSFFSFFLYVLAGMAPALAQDVAPLLRTQWGQGAPFNALCPMDSGVRALAGCGPVAMAQVIRAMRYPSRSPIDSTVYDWISMVNLVTVSSDMRQQHAVASLLRDCGTTAFTNYGAENSSSRLSNIVNAMKKLFGYSPYMMILNRNDYVGTEGERLWRKLVFGELRAGRPVIARGVKAVKGDGGHIFVIDGLRDTLVHVNFGWNGKDDGWYPLDRLGEYTRDVMLLVHIADSTYRPAMHEVTVPSPGSLRSSMPDRAWATVQALRVAGRLNASDMAWLRRISGPRAWGRQNGRLAVLDMADVDMEYLPDTAFLRSGALVRVVLPRRLRVIGRGAFADCVNLNSVDIPPTVWKIRGGAFVRCANLLDIHIPEGVRNILSRTFAGCVNLTEVRLPESIDTLGYRVFERCQRLERLYIPARTSHIGPSLVSDCPHAKVFVDERNTSFRSVDGRLEGITKQARSMLNNPSAKDASPQRGVPVPSVPDGTVVSRYKMVNGKRVFMGFVGKDGKLIPLKRSKETRTKK